MKNTPLYNQNYYRVNRDRIRSGRSTRYRKDLAYRSAVQGRARYEGRMNMMLKTDKVFHNGRIEVGYTLHTMARILGISPSSLVQWRAAGIFPSTMYKSKRKGTRDYELFAASQVYALHYIRDRINIEKISYEEVRKWLTVLWPRTFWSVREVSEYVKKGWFQGQDNREIGQRQIGSQETDQPETF